VKQVQTINLSDLTFKPERIRKGDIKALAENIKTYGLQHPLLIVNINKDREEGRWEIIDGRRRFEALKLLSADAAPCLVLTREEANEDLSLVLNTYRLNLSPYELYKIASRYVKKELKKDPDPGNMSVETIRAVAKKINKDVNATCRILRIGQLDKDTRKLLEDGTLPLRYALLTLRISEKKGRTRFCKFCIEERPSMAEAIEYTDHPRMGDGDCADLGDAVFDTEQCDTCRHKGAQDKTLFSEVVTLGQWDERLDGCYNMQCYQRKEEEAWETALKEAQEKLGLSSIARSDSIFDNIEFCNVKPVDPEQCKTCKQVKLTRVEGKLQAACPVSCSNIKTAKRSSKKEKKTPKKKPSEYTAAEKKQILEERFALAARKVMIEELIVIEGEGYEKVTGFAKGKRPKKYKRILFFVGCFAHNNPFPVFYCIGKDASIEEEEFGNDKEKSLSIAAIKELDLKKVADLNVEEAARYLSTYDRSGITPEDIDRAIELLYGEKKWCKAHYDAIKEKLSKRSKAFLKDVKPWKPTWAK